MEKANKSANFSQLYTEMKSDTVKTKYKYDFSWKLVKQMLEKSL